jgi:hypothetical protein
MGGEALKNVTRKSKEEYQQIKTNIYYALILGLLDFAFYLLFYKCVFDVYDFII